MNKSVFLNLVLQQQPITEPETEALEALAKSFPYCQTAHLLLAKAAYDRGSMLSNQKLRRAAAYATNRQLLKKLIYTTTATVVLQPVLEPEKAPDTTLQTAPEEITSSTATVATASEQITEQDFIPEPQNIELAETATALHTLDTTEAAAEPVTVEIPLTAAEATASALPEPEETALETRNETEPAAAGIPLTAAEASAFSECDTPAASAEELTETAESEINPASESVDEELARLLVIDHILNDPDLFTSGFSAADQAAFVLPDEETGPEDLAGTEAEKPEPEEEPGPETLTDFDHYLFKPEREITATEPEENLQVSYPEDESEKIFLQDPLGYWMNSSRMGECLQLKDEWTTHQKPFDFHPELLLEYNKEHPVTKTLEPADSILSQQLDIIDQFLKQNPRLKAMANARNIRTEPLEDLSLKSTKIKKDMASENLAHIFMQQGKIKKAIKIYEHLMLKIPEKKPYFVAQIEKLQNTL